MLGTAINFSKDEKLAFLDEQLVSLDKKISDLKGNERFNYVSIKKMFRMINVRFSSGLLK